MRSTLKRLAALGLSVLVTGCGEDLCRHLVETAPPTRIVGGSAEATLTCDGKAAERFALYNADYAGPSRGGDFVYFSLTFRRADAGKLLFINVRVPAGLADGSYAVGEGAPDVGIAFSEQNSAVAVTRASLSFERSRNVPLVDVEDPDDGDDFLLRADFSVSFEGTLSEVECGQIAPFVIAPQTLHVESREGVGACHSSFGR